MPESVGLGTGVGARYGAGLRARFGTLRRMIERAPVLGLIGAGNMAGAMVRGWVRTDASMAGRLWSPTAAPGGRRRSQGHGVEHVAGNAYLVARSDVVVLCVKPVDVERVLREVGELITRPRRSPRWRPASARRRWRRSWTWTPRSSGSCPTSASGGAGHAGLLLGPVHRHRGGADRAGRLPPAGEIVPLDERQFDAATALSGSGPAFLGLIFEAFEDAGIVSGLSYAQARDPDPLHDQRHRRTAPRGRPALQRAPPDGHVARRHGGGRARGDGAPGCAGRDRRGRRRDAPRGGVGLPWVANLIAFVNWCFTSTRCSCSSTSSCSWVQLPYTRC